MTYTFPELLEKLKEFDEVTLLEILDISSEEIIERFQDFIEDRYDKLVQDLQEYDE